MGSLVNTRKVITGKVRLCYVNLFTPRAMTLGDEPKYGVCILIPKADEKTLRMINSAVQVARRQGATILGEVIPRDFKLPLRDGDEERQDMPEYAGHYFINAISKEKPGVVDRGLNEILYSDEIYAGCYGKVSINFYAYNQGGNKGVGCGLYNVQKLADGEVITGRSRAEDDFSVVDEDDELGW